MVKINPFQRIRRLLALTLDALFQCLGANESPTFFSGNKSHWNDLFLKRHKVTLQTIWKCCLLHPMQKICIMLTRIIIVLALAFEKKYLLIKKNKRWTEGPQLHPWNDGWFRNILCCGGISGWHSRGDLLRRWLWAFLPDIFTNLLPGQLL